jgi:hypothetical protein
VSGRPAGAVTLPSETGGGSLDILGGAGDFMQTSGSFQHMAYATMSALLAVATAFGIWRRIARSFGSKDPDAA